MNKELKQTRNYTIIFIATIIVLYFSLKDNFKEIISYIMGANIWWILVSLFLYFGSVFLESMSMHSMILEFKKDFKPIESFKLGLKTKFFNAVTPFSSGGQPFQIYILNQQGLSLTASTNVIVQSFIVYQIALVLLGLVAIISNYMFNIFGPDPILKSLVLIGFIVNSGVAIVLFLVTFAKGFNKFFTKLIITLLNKFKLVKNKEKTIEKWNNYIHKFSDGATKIVSNKKLMFKAITLNVCGLAAFYIVPLTIAYSLGYYTSFNGLQAIVASAYVLILGSFVPIPGGTGGLEYGFIAFFSNFIKGSALTAIMIIWRTVTYYIPMIVGAIVLQIKER